MKRIAIIIFLLLIFPVISQTTDEKSTENDGSSVGSVPWDSDFNTVKDNIKGTLKYYKENSIIVSQDGEITYTYGFFFIDPELIGEEIKEGNTDTAADGTPNENAAGDAAAIEEKKSEAQYSYVIVQFPYLKMEDIKKKYVDKYGEPASDNVNNNRGVIIWENGKTMITMWIDSYENEPYCRKVNYVNKEGVEKLKDYKEKIFNQKEMKALQGIEP